MLNKKKDYDINVVLMCKIIQKYAKENDRWIGR